MDQEDGRARQVGAWLHMRKNIEDMMLCVFFLFNSFFWLLLLLHF